ncbi:uncharacterized protein LOC122366083 [Amphibalanus amphitrite]|nr:uncharacterized protein LOC122366083 [Amphibalanus amphitrite]
MNKFLEQTYPAKDEAEMLRDWGQHNVTWLEFVRETMAAHAAQQSPLSAAGALPRLFADLQRLAVGLERAALEAALTGNGSGLELFRAVQAGLMQLLCELQLALLEKQLEADAARVTDILEHDGPDLDETRERDLRNWVLMREYKAYIGHVHTVVRALREQSAAD